MKKSKRLFLRSNPWIVILVAGSILLPACASSQQPMPAATTAPTATLAPTATPPPAPTATLTAAPTAVSPTSPAATPTSDPKIQEVEAAIASLGPGDPELGQLVYETGNGKLNAPCARCHTLDGSEKEGGPTLHGISTSGAERMPGLSAEEYILQSLLDPHAYIVEGYDVSMSSFLAYLLSPEEINGLVAFLLTQ